MFAVVRVAGFQYRVEMGQVLRVPLLKAGEGETLKIEEVLLVQDGSETRVGRPTLEGAVVSAQILSHGRTPKTEAGVFKKRRKYRRRWGFRQEFTEIRIEKIQG
jgi:large subunit ribosomal protein L21